VAYRSHDGFEDHSAHAHAGVLRRDGRGGDIISRHMAGDTGFDYAHDYWRYRWCWRCPAGIGRGWNIASNIVVAWIITMPAAALIAAGCYLLSGVDA
jgi:phosphate/sulfate permease